jgi:hypothetical protein
MTYYSLGKQVLTGSQHVADAASVELAEQIAAALNRSVDDLGERPEDMTLEEWYSGQAQHSLLIDPLPAGRLRHIVRQESDEYACSCGKRWDVRDGEDHP